MMDFTQVYELYFRDVYRYVYSLCRDAHLAEEITQETFFKALKAIHQFNGSCKTTVWLCQIAKNTYITHCQKEKTKAGHQPEEREDPAMGLEAALVDEDTALRIHQIVHGLPEPYKEVFSLRVFGELSYGQIAALFGKSESWARVTYYRAKEKIKEGL